MSTFIDSNLSFLPQVSKRTIGPISGYVSMSESSADDVTSTDHPVEFGANITDHAYKNPPKLTCRLIFGGNAFDSLEETYQKLLDLQATTEPFSVVTGKRIYENMLFETLSLTTDRETDGVLSIHATFKEIVVVQTKDTNVPPQSRQKIPEKTDTIDNKGDKQAISVDPTSVDNSLIVGGVATFFGGSG